MEIILVFGDTHFPYHHKKTFKFLSLVKKEFKPTQVICLGDEIDSHSWSFHEHNPNLDNASRELFAASKCMAKLYDIFPRATVLNSNHSSLVYRKAIAHGLPSACLLPINDFLNAPRNWVWRNELTVKTKRGPVFFHHGNLSGRPMAVSKSLSMSCCLGHYHEKFALDYWTSPQGVFFQAHCGCLVDDASMAFNYNKTNLHRPILGVTVIIDGIPRLIHMRDLC